MDTLEEKKQQLLVYLVRQLNEDGDESFFPEALRDDRVLGLNEGQIRVILRRMLNEAAVETDEPVWREEDRITTPHRLTWKGIQEGEALARTFSSRIPASDRYVSVTDNQRGEISADLLLLKDAVRGSNESEEEDRERALYEIAVFEAVVVAPRAAADLIQRFVDRVLKWLTVAFSAAAVAEVVQRLVTALLALLV